MKKFLLGLSKSGKEDKNPKGHKLDLSPSTTPPGSSSDGTLTIEGKVLNCCVEDLEELNVLWRGGFAEVYQMMHKPTGHLMAVKRVGNLRKREQVSKDLDVLMREPNTNSPYLVPFYGALFREINQGEIWICMELMRTSLDRLYRRVYATPGRRMPEEVLREIATAMMHALNHLYNFKLTVTVADVKPTYILVDGKGNFKLRVRFQFEEGYLSHLTTEGLLYGSGVWSLGKAMIETATGQIPGLFFGALTSLPADLPYSVEFRDFVAQCLTMGYQESENYAFLLQKHAFIKGRDAQNNFDAKRWVTTILQEMEQPVTVIPPEITVRGTLALEAYKRALAEGKTCDKRVPVMLIGQHQSGKTSLKRSLRGEPFNPAEESTIGIDVDPSHFKVSTEIWKIGDKDQERNSETSISYEYRAARATVEKLKEEQMAPTPGERIPETKQSGNIPMVDKDPASPTGSTDIGTSVSLLNTVSQDDRSDGTSNDPESVQASRYLEQDNSIPRGIETEITKRLQNDGKVEDEEDVHSVLWDFAGQSVYYTTHPLFLTSRAIYLLVYDLSQNPLEEAKPVEKQGMYWKLLDSFGMKTNFEYLDFWMSSVASLASQEEIDQEIVESEVLPEKPPTVFLVCTHADTPYKSQPDPTTLAREIFGSMRTKPYKVHLYRDFFIVDNTMSGHGSECSEVARLRQEVLALSKALPHMKEAIPIKWLKYEKELQVMKDGGKKWIGRDAAKTVASEACNIIDDQEFQTLLTFFHDKRSLIHFSDTPELDKLVVLDPQWLIDVFKMVITVRPYDPKESSFEPLWEKLQNEGILDEKLLQHVWADLFVDKETPESLIKIMEKFSLLCVWPSSNTSCSKQYLVPSMLMSHPPEGIMSLVASARIPALFLKFESGQVPLGLFPRLVLQFFQWDQKEQGKPQLYHNFARFYTCQNEDCSIILLCHSSSIEVVVHQGTNQDLTESLRSNLSCSTDASYDTCEVTCARAVRRQLGLMLESIRNEFCWLRNMKCEVSFLCPVCCHGGALNFCRVHTSRGCKQEECLHFWSESQLCDVKVNRCDRSNAAQSNRVDIKQFTPWFAPPRNQMGVDKHNVGTLANVQGSKAIVLPHDVQESLLSQSSDAREVVRQLQETLQPDQASLQEPGPETKQLIRCLARTAKDLNRLDVLENLREITPAGTTGPLMPEHLDVQHIPVSKRRDLTIDLCGGEEWKLVAEALGLTQQEISFLDNRTLNPLDAALAFTAKQRHITVGDLYDLLSECGFPAIADLRL